jgi:hypothetical protein
MKALLVMGLLAISTTAFSGVIKSYDAKNSCNLYKVVENAKDTGDMPPLKNGETVVYSKRIYGLVLQDMEINFDAREVKVDIQMSVVLGLNKSLLKSKARIDERNPNLKKITNMLNHKLNSAKEICITADNEIIYAVAEYEE